MVLEFAAGLNSYTYKIEKQRWLIVALTVMGDLNYDATYHYGDAAGVPALELVAMNGDTSLAVGGIRFNNIRVNQPLATKERQVAKLHRPALILAVNSEQVVFHFDGPATRQRRLSVRDAIGRTVLIREVRRADTQYILRRHELEGTVVSRGVYMAEIESDGVRRSASFVWP